MDVKVARTLILAPSRGPRAAQSSPLSPPSPPFCKSRNGHTSSVGLSPHPDPRASASPQIDDAISNRARSEKNTHTHSKCADPSVSNFTAPLAICVSCGQLGKLQSVTQLYCSCNWSQEAGKQSPPGILLRWHTSYTPLTCPQQERTDQAAVTCPRIIPRLRPLQTPELSARTELLSCAAVDVHDFLKGLRTCQEDKPAGVPISVPFQPRNGSSLLRQGTRVCSRCRNGMMGRP